MTQALLTDLADYCRENIEDFDLKTSMAIRMIGRSKMPLHLLDNSFNSQIWDCYEEWAEENEINIEEMDFEVEDLLFN